MAGKTAILAVRIVSDAKQFKAGMDGATGKLDAFKSKVGKLALPATAILGGLAVVGKKFVDLAADAEQMQGGMEAVFGKASGDVDKFAKTSADRLGLSSAGYNKLAAQVGTSLKGAGVSMDQLGAKTDQLITNGADLASVFGGTTTEAVDAMGSAFRGQFDPLEKYGIIMTASMVNDRLKAKGLDKLTGAALQQAKQQEIMNMIQEESAQYAGNFAKEAGTLAGQQERLSAKFEDLGITLGSMLLPFLTQIATKFGEVLTWAQQNASTLAVLAGVVGGLAATVLLINGAMTAFVAVQTAVRGATIAATAVQTAWNAAMAANPVGLIVLAIAALVAGIILAYNNIGWFKDGVDAAMKFVGEVAANVAQWFSDAWTAAVQWVAGVVSGIVAFFKTAFAAAKAVVQTVIAAVKGFFESMSAKASAVVEAVKGFFKAGFESAKNTVSGIITAVLAIIVGIKTKADSVIESVKGFFRSGFAAAKGSVEGAIDTAKGIIQGVSDKVDTVIQAVKGFFESGFAFAGSVVEGAIAGITGAIDGITGAVQGAISWVRDLFNMGGMPGWLSKVLGMGGTGFDLPTGTAFSVPMAAPVGIGATGGLSLAKSFSGGNEPRRTNKEAERRKEGGVTNVMNVYPSAAMDEESVGKAAARELLFRVQHS